MSDDRLVDYLLGRPRALSTVARDAVPIALVAFPTGLAVALLLTRKRRNGRSG